MGTAAIGVRPPSVIFAGRGGTTTSPNNSLSVGSIDIGAAASSRQVYVLVHGVNANSVFDTNYTTSVTVAGIAATRLYNTPGSVNAHWTLWVAAVPTGTSATITVTRSTGNGFNTCLMSAFSAYDLRSTTPTDTDVTVTTASIDLPGSGIMMAMARSSVTSLVWTGGVKQFEALGGIGSATTYSAALISGTTAELGHAVSVSPGGEVFVVAAR